MDMSIATRGLPKQSSRASGNNEKAEFSSTDNHVSKLIH